MNGKGILVTATVVLAWTACCSVARAGSPVLPPGPLMTRVEELTAPDLAGRGAGSPGGRAAGDTVAAWMEQAGLAPLFDGSWFQGFVLHGEGWSGQDLAGREGRNVGGMLQGRGSLAGRWFLVCAHYDHLGRKDPDSTGLPGPEGYYPGANDNASGVAVLMEIATRLAATRDSCADCRSVMVVSFDGEEVGLQGSRYMAEHMPAPLDSLDAVINLDTVGQMPQGKLYVSGVGTTPVFADLAVAAGRQGPELSLAPGGWSGSDHMTFAERRIPVLFLFGGPYPQYNRPADTAGSLSAEALSAVAGYAVRLAGAVRSCPGPLPWTGETREPAGTPPEVAGRHRNTWLGTMPDFTAGISGYMIGGVFDGSPAAAAGLAKGDVITRFGGLEVTDLKTFTTALRTFAPGTPVEITVLRGDRPLNFTVVLGDRSQRR